ncbi:MULTISPECIES: ABC transporter substrate-binding protein [Bradyrhizobium]|uniref:ABC transport system substrate-binding protein n=2 Tax=Bradyrhizobium TaxID=374 RepID=A0ABY0Q9X8_9BRAD|nr:MULTISPECIES: ABC transporter substrate-binding protein [Bradyrhizobium]SDJ75479.1 putative ABC transport system substrate-binding protein [Bradyrhizobium ottawaense]SEC17018.1 putative ABC transport system substrate-binding protein [Bradyrhizobium lablabi]SHM78416.1 putative ABC transport system substrate-binding protein [Bradyrhizobium lablabi]
MRRREFIGLLGGAVAWPLAAHGQQPASRIIGVLGFGSIEAARTGFVPTQRRLAEMGYVEGRNLTIEYRGANGRENRLAELAAELVQRRVDAIVVFAGQSIVAAKAATTSIPILFFTGFDPVQSGFVASLNRPGGNATGISVLNTELLAKRLQVLCELMPSAKSIAFLYSPTGLVSGGDSIGNELASAAEALAVKLSPVEARHADDFDAAFTTMVNERPDAVLVSADALMFQNRATLVRLAARHRLPAVYPIREFVAGGGLMSYGTNYSEAYRQVGDYVGRVLNGEKPENLPVQRVTKLELVINITTAKALGLTVPPTLLARADDVIE